MVCQSHRKLHARDRTDRNVQAGEVLPDETSVILRAGNDVRREQSPRHALRDAGNGVGRHREQTLKLPEDHLLSGLDRNGIQQQGGASTRVEVLEEAVNARLAERSELLGEVDEVTDIPEGVRVVALLGCNAFCKKRNNVVRKTGPNIVGGSGSTYGR